MYPNLSIYITRRGTVFLSDGEVEHLFPLKKGTPEAVYVKGDTIFYGCLLFKLNAWDSGEVVFRHSDYEILYTSAIHAVRTVEDLKVNIRAHQYLYPTTEYSVHSYDLLRIDKGLVYEFLLHWVFDLPDQGVEYQYSEGASLGSLSSKIAKYAQENTKLPEYQSAAIHNLAFKLYTEAYGYHY